MLVISPAGELTLSQVLSGVSSQPPALAGLRIGLRLADPGVALSALARLDSIADTVVLFSPSLTPTAVAESSVACSLDAILTDTPREFEGIPGSIPAFGDFESMTGLVGSGQGMSSTKWVLMTSGTTGKPKPVAHSLDSLTRTTKLSRQQGAGVRWGMLYDYSRFAGLQVLLQAALSGSTLIAPAYGDTLEDKILVLSAQGVTHLSATPSLWRKILMTPGAERLDLRQITLGGEISDDRILAALSTRYPGARITHIFASTEAGAAFSVTDKKAGFPISYLSSPQNGIEIKVEENRLYIRNTLVQPKYLGSDEHFAVTGGWVDTGDAVEVAADRVLFKGRASGVINVGGDKVHPEEIEGVLLAHHMVAAAHVYAKSNPIVGSLVAADVVLADSVADVAEARNAILAYARSQVGRHKAPAMIRIVSGLEMNASGKLTRST